MTEDLFTTAAQSAKRSNVPEMSVSELAFSLKRTLEETYGRVRVRGELSGLKLASSGHLYGDLKDEDSCINIVCWRSSMGRLSIKPEDGLDVIITGKMTSYPKNSRYQLVIESMELAGEGALLKMLEERRKKLAAEGLFDEARKKPLPFLPDVIGVVTSPTGAVIRDIIHRISERFPRHVLVWPVAVQGDGSAQQIAAAIRGFNAMKNRPDLLIVARGGGSLEDLMAFNDEDVVRAAAASEIPLISAVGHETDTTLIDHAADLRAPTPTGAAERAVPVRLNLMAQVLDDHERLTRGVERLLREGSNRLETLRARLGSPERVLDIRTQHIDTLSSKLLHGFEKLLAKKSQALAPLAPPHPRALIGEKSRHAAMLGETLQRAGANLLKDPQKHLLHAARMLESLSFQKVLDRGFAVVRAKDGRVLSDAKTAESEGVFDIQFRGNATLPARKS
jgi:exodeoxyribonuclease VII large subunit